MHEDSARLIACLPRLRRYARALLGDDDLVQDTVERGWDRLASWRRDGDMRAWLFGIMHNLHVDQLRRPAVATVALDEMSYDEVAATLHIPRGTVMSRLSRGRERLRLLMLGQPVAAALKVVK